MKIKNKLILSFLLIVSAVSCIDDFEEINSDPNKIYEVTLQSIFPGTVYRTMTVISEMNYNRFMSYSRYVTVTPFQVPWNEKGDGYYRKFYVEILRDLNALETKYATDENSPNSFAIVNTWKAFVYYQMISIWGPVGLSDAYMESTDKRIFRYDSEKSAYLSILDMLDVAVETFDPSSDNKLLRDPVYEGGDIDKWRKLANTLRLEIAMNIQNISPEKALEYATKSMVHEEWLFSSLNDALAPKFGNVDKVDGSYYYTRLYKEQIEAQDKWDLIPCMNEYFSVYLFSYKDPRMQVYFQESNATKPEAAPYLMPDYLTRPHDCIVSGCSAAQQADHLQLIIEGKELRDSLRVRYNIPYVPTGDGARLPFGWEMPYDPTDPNGTLRISDPLNTNDNANRCFIQPEYYAIDMALPLLRLADAHFLCAEAKVKFGLGSKSAKDYYEAGIRASFEECGILSDLPDYIEQDGIAWGTNGKGLYDTRKLIVADINGANGEEGALEQIYKQRYLADFLDGFSAWRMERRTRALNFPPFFLNGSQTYEEGGDIYYGYPERLYFPDVERQTNSQAYYEAIDLLQQNSPQPNSARWGDNIFTTLNFAKIIPNLQATIAGYKDIHYVEFNMDMQEKKYGKNYEEFVKTARSMTGITDDDEKALVEAFSFEIRSVINTYVVEE